MQKNDLKKFADQLARWAREMIECGRTPFRMVESEPRIGTRLGDLFPPLVFWINRQSLQAAGIVFFPQKADDGLMECDACAEALGLEHFVTWTTDRVTIWQRSAGGPLSTKEFPIKGDDVAAFHQQLHSLMNELKVLAVTGAVPPRNLPADYVVNLCRNCLEAGIPSIQKNCRQYLMQQEEIGCWIDSEQLAWHTAGTGLMRLLLVHWHDTLPSQLHPERLERAFELSRSQLPKRLRPLLDQGLPLPELPHSFRVPLLGLHHRLEQLSWRKNPERATQTLEKIWPWLLEHLGMQGLEPEWFGADLCKDPTLPFSYMPAREISCWPTSLLMRALWRETREEGHPSYQLVQPMDDLAVTVEESLYLPAEQGGRPLSGRPSQAPWLDRLRHHWPQRRFDLPSGTPAGLFQVLHWQGQAGVAHPVEIVFPATWLQRSFIREMARSWAQTSFPTEVRFTEEGRCHCRTNVPDPLQVTLKLPDEERRFDWVDLPSATPATLLLAALAPLPLLNTIHQGRLYWASGEELPSPGLLRYLETPLAADCWQLLTGKPIPSPSDIQRVPAGLPLPREGLLKLLERETLEGESSADRVLQHLCDWLQWETLPTLSIPAWLQSTRAEPSRTPKVALEEALHQTIRTLGQPRFPDTYLYRKPELRLRGYRITPPLEVGESFFGQVDLEDAAGRRFQVDEATAMALQLATPSDDEEVQLPTDSEQVLSLINDYRQDLVQLWQQLEQVVSAHCSGPRQAERRLRAFWEELSVPLPEDLPAC